jgi:RecB family exonuclease
VADKDVLGKADALLRRHSLPLPGSGGDAAGVPVLTEFVEPPGAATSQLAQAIFERVMKEVEGRLAADLERRVAQHLAGQVHAAVATAIGDMHAELAHVIGEAIKQELERRPLK